MLFGRLGRSLMLMHVLEVVEAVATLAGASLLQVLQELIVFGVTLANDFGVDLLLVTDVKDHITVLLVLLDLFENNFAIVSNWKFFCCFGLGRIEKMKNAIRRFARKFSEIDSAGACFTRTYLPSTPLAISKLEFGYFSELYKEICSNVSSSESPGGIG